VMSLKADRGVMLHN